MIDYNIIYFFVFIFTSLVLFRTAARFVGSLLQNPPQRLILSNRELIYNALSLSYLLTYLIK